MTSPTPGDGQINAGLDEADAGDAAASRNLSPAGRAATRRDAGKLTGTYADKEPT